jgi:hypothetical protein
LQVVEPCDSCGMPMREIEEHGGGDWNNPHCVHCTNRTGKLKSRQEVRESLIELYMSRMELPREEIEKMVDKQMKKLPAWKDPTPY